MWEHFLIDVEKSKEKKAFNDPEYDDSEQESYTDNTFDEAWNSDEAFEADKLMTDVSRGNSNKQVDINDPSQWKEV